MNDILNNCSSDLNEKLNVLNLDDNMSSNSTNIYQENGYTSLYQIVTTSAISIIFFVGMLGNILVVMVVSRTKTMHSPTNCYLISLSIADILVLLSASLPSIPEPYFQKDEWPWGPIACSVLVFLQYLGVDASSLSITAFTVERYIAICHPMKAQRMCTVERAKRIIAVIWIFSILYCAPWLGLTHVVPVKNRDIERCDFRLERNKYLAYYMTDLIAFYVIPLFISGILYALIARILFMNTLPNNQGNFYKNSGRCRVRKTTKNSRKQVVRMLIVIVSVFATLWLPYRVMVVYNSFAKQRYMDIWFLLFCKIMIYINSAINPILYNAMSMKFRRAFQRVLCCGITAQKSNETGTEQSNESKISMQTHIRQTVGESSYLMLHKSKQIHEKADKLMHNVSINGTTL